jgi:prolipoprotein diacylglyceryltransferase
MAIHTVFDLLGWTLAALIGRWISGQGWLSASVPRRTLKSDPHYFTALALGAILGAILFGSVNLNLAGFFTLGHSIAGALAGGIVAVEVYKWRRGLRGSTGAMFVAPLALGIAVGRIGCFLAGIPDYTYGIPTTLPWGADFGDGVRRHPVQLYESAAMLMFLLIYLRGIARGHTLFLRKGFYVFVAWYGAQRFMWEFLKPYPKLLGPFNLFHMLCLAMIAYSSFMIARSRDLRPAV